ncbi:MAG: MFS transporter [Chlamydiota bacterium]|nr:MFS transporter [Chlamydiota bacterium]
MLDSVRSFFSILLSVTLFMLGAGYFVSFQSLILSSQGYSEAVIGLVQSAYYAGLLLGSMKVEGIIHRVGHIRALAASASICSVTILSQGLYFSPLFWLVLRFSAGFCLAGVYVVIESWMLEKSTEENRGVILSVYMATLYTSQAAGQFFINIIDLNSLQPFIVGGLLCACGVIPVALTKAASPEISEPVYTNISAIMKKSPFGFLGCILSGMILSSIYSFGPNFAQENGISPASLMSITIFGGVLLQLPIGKISDIFDRRTVLLVTSVVTILPCLLILMFSHTVYFIHVVSFLLGGLCFTLYPLSLTQACDRIHPKALTSLTAVLLLAYGIGAVIGPLIAPMFMLPFGIDGLYVYIATLAALLSVIGLVTIVGVKPIPEEEQNEFVALPNISPVAYDMDPRVELED